MYNMHPVFNNFTEQETDNQDYLMYYCRTIITYKGLPMWQSVLFVRINDNELNLI